MMHENKPRTLLRDPYCRPVHPGEILREDVFSALDLSLAEFALKVGIAVEELAEIMNESRPVTSSAADGIGALCGNGPIVWLRLQEAYDEWQPPAHDLRHATMHMLADWSVLSRIAIRHTKAKRLDSRAVAALYARATDADWQEMTESERAFGQAALTALPQSEGCG